MINTARFGAFLKELGFAFFSGVPCSYLKNLINFAINECLYVAATNEGDAVANACGAAIAGKKAVVLMQNSGLTNATSPLISLTYPFKIPILGFVSLRGEPGQPDEPQHELMGQITGEMLSLMKINWEYLASDIVAARRQLQRANAVIEQDESFFFIVKKGSFSPVQLFEKSRQKRSAPSITKKISNNQVPTRYEALTVINSLKDSDTIQLATTGKTGRELYEIEDAPNNLYMVGSMGCVSSLGAGMALARPDKAIVAIDGDGALLMRLGNLATNGSIAPPNLLHIVLDNSSYDSTGGQLTVAETVQFVEVAASCGYENSIYVHNLGELAEMIQAWKQNKCLTFLYLKIAPGSKRELGRPKMKPYQVKERLKVFIDG